MTLRFLAPTVPVAVAVKCTGSNIDELNELANFFSDHNLPNFTAIDNGDESITLRGGNLNGLILHTGDWVVALPNVNGFIPGVSSEILPRWTIYYYLSGTVNAQYLEDNVSRGHGSWQYPTL